MAIFKQTYSHLYRWQRHIYLNNTNSYVSTTTMVTRTRHYVQLCIFMGLEKEKVYKNPHKFAPTQRIHLFSRPQVVQRSHRTVRPRRDCSGWRFVTALSSIPWKAPLCTSRLHHFKSLTFSQTDAAVFYFKRHVLCALRLKAVCWYTCFPKRSRTFFFFFEAPINRQFHFNRMTQFGNNDIKESQKNPSRTLDDEVLGRDFNSVTR